MLSDSVRTSSYRDALVKNPDSLRDALVLDIGCGTGILSMFDAQAGAKDVLGVECSDIIYKAMDIVRENKMDDKVKLVKGRLEENELPYEKYDIIVSEWMVILPPVRGHAGLCAVARALKVSLTLDE